MGINDFGVYDYIFKVIIIGNGSVGKTTLMTQFCKKVLTEKLPTTIGVDFQIVDINIGEKLVKLNIWDTAGQERFNSLTSKYYRDADAVILVFDLSNKQSFESIEDWLAVTREHCSSDIYKILVGNKCDLPLAVSFYDIKNLASLHDLKFFETCAVQGENVEDTFHQLATDLVSLKDQLTPYLSIDSGPSSLFLHMQEKEQRETYCCSYY